MTKIKAAERFAPSGGLFVHENGKEVFYMMGANGAVLFSLLIYAALLYGAVRLIKYFIRYGDTTLRVGIEKSRNLMTVRLARWLGIDKIIDYAKRHSRHGSFGFKGKRRKIQCGRCCRRINERQDIRRIIAFKFFGLIRPAQRRKRPNPRRKPRIENIGVLL